MNITSPAGVAQAFVPLAALLQAASPKLIKEVQQRAEKLDRPTLSEKFCETFRASKRVAAYLLAQELISRNVAPSLWHPDAAVHEYGVNQKFDAFIFDLLHLRQWHYLHAQKIRYQRCKTLLNGSEKAFHREAEFAFYQGKRPVWKLVASLSLTEAQQWECHLLRSGPIVKRADVMHRRSNAVRLALANDLDAVRRTATFGDAEAAVALSRRHTIWKCLQMTRGSPSEIASLYRQMTGEEIGRQVVANQLQKIDAALRNIEMTTPPKTEMTRMVRVLF